MSTMTLRPIRRFLVWLRDSLPLYSWRRCCIEWEAGREFERQQIGIVRGPHGHFASAKPRSAATHESDGIPLGLPASHCLSSASYGMPAQTVLPNKTGTESGARKNPLSTDARQ